MNIQKLEALLDSKKACLNIEKGKRDIISKRLEENNSLLQAKLEYKRVLEETGILLGKISEFQRKQACKKIEDLGTYALNFIFGDQYSLIVKTNERSTDVDILVKIEQDNGPIEVSPQDDCGGGIVDVVCIALKIVMLVSFQPVIDGPIILDEPGKHVSNEYIEALVSFLKKVSAEFDRQIILVTHNVFLAESADARYDVSIPGTNGTSVVNKIK